MRKAYRYPLVASVLLGLTACDPRLVTETQPGVIIPEGALDSDKIEQIGDSCYVESFHQPDVQRTDKLDLLFVVDTSASLAFERNVVANRIDRYIKELPRDTHYRISVLLAHGKRSRWSGRNYYDGLLSPAVFDSKKHSPAWIRLNLSIRMNLVPSDYWSDGGEASFYSLNKALEGESLARFRQQGFFRDDAALSVIFVSDENELCYEYPTGVTPQRDFDTYRGRTLEDIAREENCRVTDAQGQSHWLNAQYMHQRLKAFKGAQPVSVGAIVHTKKTLKNLLPRAEDEYGYGFAELVALNQGELVDIRDKDYTEGLERLGRNAAATMTIYQKFALTHTDISPSSLGVKVDHQNRTEFSWLADEGVVFVKDAGTARSLVEINYCLATPNVDGGGDNSTGTDPGTDPGTDTGTDPGTENPGNSGDNDDDTPQTPDEGEPGDGGDLPGGCTAVDCGDIGL